MDKHLELSASFILVLVFALPAMAQDYDLVILNGRVMDPETMCDAIANVGIKGGMIAAITEDTITGKETIDAKGLVVAPGFIDTQFHSLTPFGIKMGLRDGVTTALDLENGILNTAARYGRLSDFHQRFHLSAQTPTEAPLGFDEVFTNAFLTDAPMLMAQDNDYGWWEIEEKLQLARHKGLNLRPMPLNRLLMLRMAYCFTGVM